MLLHDETQPSPVSLQARVEPAPADSTGILTRAGLPRLWRHDPALLWRYLRYVVPPVLQALAPSAAYGVEKIPRSGGVVLAANHLSAIDHPLLGIYSPRPIYFFSKAELLERPVIGEALAWTGAFAVRRGEPDREAIRIASRHLAAGRVVGVHVEGTRQRFGHPGDAKPGAAYLALREQVPVVPCGLETFAWSLGRSNGCAVVFGSPLQFSGSSGNRDDVAMVKEELEVAITDLWRQACEAVAAGFPELLPDGTPRASPVSPGEEGE